MFWRSTPAYLDYWGRSVPGTIASLETVTLGGWPQAVLMRGADETRPVLLYLHGGPGDAEIWTARRRQAELERAFIVANWDQRGAGLSYGPGLPRESMTVDQLVSDTVELSRWLAQRFQRERIVLMGHSWGTILGLLAARRAPELYQAYIGIGQVVEPAESELRMYRWALKEAERLGRRRAMRELQETGPPPYTSFQDFRRTRRWVARLGGRVHEHNETSIVLDALAHLNEYTLRDMY
ncbi:MAG: alpha/beta hydrolase, partial [Thermoplasmata archaeon]|nr:alpha/beta hydrolase [Thermoplasmata archaeon]